MTGFARGALSTYRNSVFSSLHDISPRVFVTIRNPTRGQTPLPIYLFNSSSPHLSSLYYIQSSYLHAPSSPESWVGSSCPLFSPYLCITRFNVVTLIRLVHSKVPGHFRPSPNHRVLSPTQTLNLDAWSFHLPPLPLFSLFLSIFLVSWDSPLTASSVQPTSIDHTK